MDADHAARGFQTDDERRLSKRARGLKNASIAEVTRGFGIMLARRRGGWTTNSAARESLNCARMRHDAGNPEKPARRGSAAAVSSGKTDAACPDVTLLARWPEQPCTRMSTRFLVF